MLLQKQSEGTSFCEQVTGQCGYCELILVGVYIPLSVSSTGKLESWLARLLEVLPPELTLQLCMSFLAM